MRGTDIVPGDPLGFQFSGNVLNVSVSKATRDVIGVSACISQKRNTVHWTFEFLDPGDGAILKVLHDGNIEPLKCVGTLIGLTNGMDHWSLEHRRYWWKAKSDAGHVVLIGIFAVLFLQFAFVRSVMGIFGVDDFFERPLLAAGAAVLLLILSVGACAFVVGAWRRWRGLSVLSRPWTND